MNPDSIRLPRFNVLPLYLSTINTMVLTILITWNLKDDLEKLSLRLNAALRMSIFPPKYLMPLVTWPMRALILSENP